MTDLIAFVSQVSKIGFVPLILLIGYFNYTREWIWRRELDRAEAAWAKAEVVWALRLAKAEADAEQYKQIVLQTVGIAETSVNIAKTKQASQL